MREVEEEEVTEPSGCILSYVLMKNYDPGFCE